MGAAPASSRHQSNSSSLSRGLKKQGENAAAAEAPIFAAWAAPLKDLGVGIISPRGVVGTDHDSFDRLGVPAFQFVQERYEYNSRTHHSTMDVYDRGQPDDVKQTAIVAAVFAWQAATRDAPLPRRPLQAEPAPATVPNATPTR